MTPPPTPSANPQPPINIGPAFDALRAGCDSASAFDSLLAIIRNAPTLIASLDDQQLAALRRETEDMKQRREYGIKETIMREQLLRVLKPVENVIERVADPEIPTGAAVGKNLLDLARGTGCHILPPHLNDTSGVAYYIAYTYLRPGGSFTNGISFSELAKGDPAKLAAAAAHETFHLRQHLTIPATSLACHNTETPVILTPLDAVVMNILLEAPTSAFEAYMSSMMAPDLPGVADVKNTISGLQFAGIRKTSPSLKEAFETAAAKAMDAAYTRDDAPADKRIDFLNYYVSQMLRNWRANVEMRLIPDPKAPLFPYIGELTTDDIKPFGDIMGVHIFQDKTIDDMRQYVMERLTPENRALLAETNAFITARLPGVFGSITSARDFLAQRGDLLADLHQRSIRTAPAP